MDGASGDVASGDATSGDATSGDSRVGDGGCAPGEAVAIATTCTPPATTLRLRDVVQTSYLTGGACPMGDNSRCVYVARPMDTATHPAVLVIHGGGFTGGGPGGELDVIGRLRDSGYVGVSVGYRLCTPTTGANAFPAGFSDVRCALRHVQANAAMYGIDPTRIAVLGSSAGAVLATMLAVAPESSALDDGTCPLTGPVPRVRATLAYYGGYDLSVSGDFSAAINDTLRQCGGTVPTAAISAVSAIDATDPPILMLHGTDDMSVSVRQSELGLAAFRAACVQSTLFEVPGAGHAFVPLDPMIAGASAADGLTATCTAMAFLQRTLGR